VALVAFVALKKADLVDTNMGVKIERITTSSATTVGMK
jgi:hypothetical protein